MFFHGNNDVEVIGPMRCRSVNAASIVLALRNFAVGLCKLTDAVTAYGNSAGIQRLARKIQTKCTPTRAQLELCAKTEPNRKHAHLMLHSKKFRVRKKWYHKDMKDAAKRIYNGVDLASGPDYSDTVYYADNKRI
jgi:hypothetical protein